MAVSQLWVSSLKNILPDSALGDFCGLWAVMETVCPVLSLTWIMAFPDRM